MCDLVQRTTTLSISIRFYLNDKVEIFGQIGYITGFSGTSSVYVKDINDEYITIPEKEYKQVSISSLKFINHNNNWQYESNWIN